MTQPERQQFHEMLLAKQTVLQDRMARRDDLEVQVSPDEFDARLQLVDRVDYCTKRLWTYDK